MKEVNKTGSVCYLDRLTTSYHFHSAAIIPLVYGDHVFGILQLLDPRPYTFNREMINFLENLSKVITTAILRLRSEYQVNDRIRELNVLHNMSILADISHSVEEFIQGVIELIPSGFVNPDLVACKITIGSNVYGSAKASDQKKRFQVDIIHQDWEIGKMEVGIYPDKLTGLSVSKFSQGERELMITVSKLIGEFIANQRSSLIQDIIYKISTYTNLTTSLEELMKYIRKQLSRLIDTQNLFLALYDQETGTLSVPFGVD